MAFSSENISFANRIDCTTTYTIFYLPILLYIQIVVVFYVAIVLLLIGTNLRAGGAGRGARFKKHVVEYTEGAGAESRLVPAPSPPRSSPGGRGQHHHPSCQNSVAAAAAAAVEAGYALGEDDIVEV